MTYKVIEGSFDECFNNLGEKEIGTASNLQDALALAIPPAELKPGQFIEISKGDDLLIDYSLTHNDNLLRHSYGPQTILDSLLATAQQLKEAKETARSLAATIIGDSIDAVEFNANDPYVGGWVFTDEAWEANREAAVNALNTIGDNGKETFKTMLEQLKKDREAGEE